MSGRAKITRRSLNLHIYSEAIVHYTPTTRNHEDYFFMLISALGLKGAMRKDIEALMYTPHDVAKILQWTEKVIQEEDDKKQGCDNPDALDKLKTWVERQHQLMSGGEQVNAFQFGLF